MGLGSSMRRRRSRSSRDEGEGPERRKRRRRRRGSFGNPAAAVDGRDQTAREAGESDGSARQEPAFAGGPAKRRRPGRRRTPPRKALLRSGIVLGTALAGAFSGYRIAAVFFFPPRESPVALREVPDLRGMTNAAALQLLASSGLEASRLDSVSHPEAPRGAVIGQSPLPGRTALWGAGVRLAVSTGPSVRPVPDVTRLPGRRAAAVLAAAGFAVLVDTVESSDPADRVVGIEPPPGEPLAVPSAIRIRVSSGPPTLAMPDLTGMDEGRALAVLDSLGLVAGEVGRRFSLSHQGAVFGQAPPPGALVEQGGRVELVVGEPPRPRLRR